jgi:CubicO group peptidase (beta-lactamase class C family)/putative intracellular protease/amidase
MLWMSISLLSSSFPVLSQNKILFVVSNQDHYGNSNIRAANHFGELAVPYDIFTKSGYTVDFVSPKGGAVPIGYINTSDSVHKKYLYNHFFMDKLKNTLKPAQVIADNYNVIFYGGGGAAMFGVPDDISIQKIAKQIYKQNGIVSAICHGTAGLAHLKDENGKSIYSGKKITGFADKFEDTKEEYYRTFPFSINRAITDNHGKFVHDSKLGTGFYVADGQFVTGQDPSSASNMTNEIIALIEKEKPLKIIQSIDKVFTDWNNDLPNPGVAAGLIKGDKIIYLKGFGYADVNQEIPVTVDSRFQIGAMSKQFTAFAILLLEEQGKLNLSDEIHKYIPQLPDYGQPLTIKHLLSQSSGLHDFMALKKIAGWREKDLFTQQDALDLILHQKKLDYTPGTKFSQTSSGLILLTEVIKTVTGQTLAAFTQEHIFQPLGLANTFFRDDNEMIIPNVATSYGTTKNGLKHNLINHSIVGTTNLYTSAADLIRWYLNFERPKIGTKKLIEKLLSPVTLNDGRTTFNPTAGRLLYGQQYLHAERGLPKMWTYGLEGGYASNIFIFPDQKVTSFVLGNNNRYNGGLAMNMAIEVLGDIFPEPPGIDFSKLKTTKIQSLQLSAFAGNYWDSERASALKFYVKEDTLRFRVLSSTTENALVPLDENTFQMVIDSDDIIKFRFRKEGNELKLIYTSGESDEHIYARYIPLNYSEADLKDFSGTYYCKSLNVSYTFVQTKDGLKTSNKSNGNIRFTTITPDLFQSNDINFGSIRFIRDQENRITGFHVNSDKIKKLHFEKCQ